MRFNIRASLEALERQNAEGAIKIREDLERYKAVIAKSRPQTVIECGTWQGASALWFARQGLRVITIDLHPQVLVDAAKYDERITFLVGNSADPKVRDRTAALIEGQQTMVVLDSDHNPHHVRQEIELYGPLVTPGCYLVVEDGLIRWIPSPFPTRLPSPLDAVELLLVDDPQWRRDRKIEDMHPVSMNPMGWWQKEKKPGA